ncbi:MAG: chemotaxis protein methyltransferase CheR [Frankiaceae bacterium]|nr:chemotaxis protein methyltransferase CheR [Frankiaceae bacterium]
MNRLPLSDAEFAAFAQLLRDTAGLAFDLSRREALAFCVNERMRASGCTDVGAYLALLTGPAGDAERQALLDEVTIPETHFFRNPPQIRALRKHVLPELLRQAAGTKRLRIWSAGCSTGEEPYTIAMLLRELLPVSSGWDIRIIATDISTRALGAAEAARYAERAFVMTEPLDQQRFFYLDTDRGGYVVRDEVRELVEFRHHNLVTDAPPFEAGELDLVLCRNVTIYFDRTTTKRLMQRLHGCLRDGGYLFLGHAETLWQISDDFSLVPLGDAFVYRRGEPASERRAVLPDRRTEDELRPTRADRRRGPINRRDVVDDVMADSATPSPPVRPMLAVRTAVAQGKYAEAADLAAEIVTATPLRSEAHYLHGLALGNLGRDGEALVVLRKAVYLDPEDGFAHFLLGGCLERQGEHLAAARSYRAAASTLGHRPFDAVAPELGGRSVAELSALCHELALRAEGTVRGDENVRGERHR